MTKALHWVGPKGVCVEAIHNFVGFAEGAGKGKDIQKSAKLLLQPFPVARRLQYAQA